LEIETEDGNFSLNKSSALIERFLETLRVFFFIFIRSFACKPLL